MVGTKTMNITEPMANSKAPVWQRLLCGKPGAGLIAGLWVGSLVACSPSHNWRTWSAGGAPVQAMIPCKPDVAQREVNLGGANTELHLHSCDNQGLRFALAWVAVPATVDAQQLMAQWQKASAQSLQSEQAPQAMDLSAVRGATHTAWWSMQGRDHRGQAVQSQAVYFTDGQRVYQAAVYGPPWDEAPVAPFWEGLKLP
jgi:hypothetical protein